MVPVIYESDSEKAASHSPPLPSPSFSSSWANVSSSQGFVNHKGDRSKWQSVY